MKDPAKVIRGAVVGCLVLAPVLMLISSALQPPFETDHVDNSRASHPGRRPSLRRFVPH